MDLGRNQSSLLPFCFIIRLLPRASGGRAGRQRHLQARPRSPGRAAQLRLAGLQHLHACLSAQGSCRAQGSVTYRISGDKRPRVDRGGAGDERNRWGEGLGMGGSGGGAGDGRERGRGWGWGWEGEVGEGLGMGG